MPSPSVAVRRRPFLAPLWLAAAAVIFTSFVLYGVVRASIAIMGKTTTLVVVRHAEKAEEGGSDPLLSSAGQERALRLADMLGDERIAAIYVTDTRRSQLTAAPLAARLGLTPTVLAARDTAALLENIGDEHVGGKVVIVGHSNTVPAIVATLSRGRATPRLGDDDYDSLFVVTVTRFGPPAVLQLRY